MQANWFRITNETEVPSPSLLIFPERIEENLSRMIACVGDVDRLRPHVKTHKLPQVIALEIKHGISKFKVATIAEAEMTAQSGGRDILVAYPQVGPGPNRLTELVKKFPHVVFRAIADSDCGIDALSRAATAGRVEIDVLLDLNLGMNRTGISPGKDAEKLYRHIVSASGLSAGGLHAYDGHLHDADYARLTAAAEAAFVPVWNLRDGLIASGLSVPRIVASGTPTFSILAKRSDIELGAGTTVLWDEGQKTLSPDLDFLSAAILMTRVISRPTDDSLCLDIGHKSVASEMPHPRVKIFGLEDASFVLHSEEHLVVRTPKAAEFPVGSVLYAMPRHICPTVALHSDVCAVRGGRVVEIWPVVARTRRITI